MAAANKNTPIVETLKNLPWIWIAVCLLGFIVGLIVVHQYGDRVLPSSVKIDKSMNEVTLYFISKEGKRLKPEKATIKRGSLEAEILGVVEGLIKGSWGPLDRAIPIGTRIRDVKVNGSIALIDFSSHIKNKHWGGTTAELLTVYSIVNSVVFNFDSIKKVQILIEGERFDTLAGHLRIDSPLAANRKIIEE